MIVLCKTETASVQSPSNRKVTRRKVRTSQGRVPVESRKAQVRG